MKRNTFSIFREKQVYKSNIKTKAWMFQKVFDTIYHKDLIFKKKKKKCTK